MLPNAIAVTRVACARPDVGRGRTAAAVSAACLMTARSGALSLSGNERPLGTRESH